MDEKKEKLELLKKSLKEKMEHQRITHLPTTIVFGVDPVIDDLLQMQKAIMALEFEMLKEKK